MSFLQAKIAGKIAGQIAGKIAPKTQSSVEKSIFEAVPLVNKFLHKKVKEKTQEEQIKELRSKLSNVSKENETYKKILDMEQQQLKESMNLFGQRPAKIFDDDKFSPNSDEVRENPSEKGLYFQLFWNYYGRPCSTAKYSANY